MTYSDIAATLTGERTMTKDAGGHDRPSREEIAQLAYIFYENRGRRDGKDLDDWLAAERELVDHYRSARPDGRHGYHSVVGYSLEQIELS